VWEEEKMTEMKISGRYRLFSAIVILILGVGAVGAQQTAPPLRLGILTDMSSLYADATGPGSVLAANMAVEDFLASRTG
jgi:branched-chain amino acid transport system substrate-binding protein